MASMAALNDEEKEIFMHHLMNERDSVSQILAQQATSQEFEKSLAKKVLEEQFNQKNYYRNHQKKLKFADPKRQPIDERKLKDILRNKPQFRHHILNEVGNYDGLKDNIMHEHGIMTYLHDSHWGDMKALIKDIGIKKYEN